MAALVGVGCTDKDECQHEYGAIPTTVVEVATCTSRGEEIWTCLKCGEEHTIMTETLPHHFDNGRVKTTATCKREGEILYECMDCDGTKIEAIPIVAHSIVQVPQKTPTCTESGYTAYTYCSVCTAYLLPKLELSALGHNEVVVKGYAATCTNSGETNAVFCSVCNEELKEAEIIPAKGHNVVTVPGYAATCSTTGKGNGSSCSTCGEVFVEGTIIPATGLHVFNSYGKCAQCGVSESDVENDDNEAVTSGVWQSAYDSGGNYVSIPATSGADVSMGFNSAKLKRNCDVWYDIKDESHPNYGIYNGNANFNCYSFVIGKTDSVYRVGDISGFDRSVYGNESDSSYAYANGVLADLVALNKQNIYWTTQTPNLDELGDNENLFCFRVAHDSQGNYVDYHCYKYSKADNAWYGKHGTTSTLLRLKDGIQPWTASDKDGTSAWFDEQVFGATVTDNSLYYVYDVMEDGVIPNNVMISMGTCYASTIYYFKWTECEHVYSDYPWCDNCGENMPVSTAGFTFDNGGDVNKITYLSSETVQNGMLVIPKGKYTDNAAIESSMTNYEFSPSSVKTLVFEGETDLFLWSEVTDSTTGSKLDFYGWGGIERIVVFDDSLSISQYAFAELYNNGEGVELIVPAEYLSLYQERYVQMAEEVEVPLTITTIESLKGAGASAASLFSLETPVVEESLEMSVANKDGVYVTEKFDPKNWSEWY